MKFDAKLLKTALLKVESNFDLTGETQNDPVKFPMKYSKVDDKEVVAFITAVFSYGRVKQIQATVEVILELLGKNPAKIIRESNGHDWIKKIPTTFRHRFNNHDDLGLLLTWLGEALRESQGLEKFFSLSPNSEENLEELLETFIIRLTSLNPGPYSPLARKRSLRFLLPQPSRKSGCKRLLLFLRWVAGKGPMDLAIWKNFPREKLLIPVDTHVLRISKHLGLTRRNDNSWATSVDITKMLKTLSRSDPTRFDFAICHLGISKACPSRYNTIICKTCSMNHVCLTYKKSVKSN